MERGIAEADNQIVSSISLALIAAYEPFRIFLINFPENGISTGLLMASGAVICVWLLITLMGCSISSYFPAAMVVASGIFIFFNFGVITYFWEGLLGPRFSAYFTLAIQMLLFLIVVRAVYNARLLVWFHGNHWRVVLALYVPAILMAISGGFFPSNHARGQVALEYQSDLKVADIVLRDRSNVYIFIPDMYARHDVLKQMGHDNEEFLEKLSSLGFFVNRESLSNYPTTPQSLGSLVALGYPYTERYNYDFNLVTSLGVAGQIFRQNGYKTIFAESGGNSELSCAGNTDICFKAGVIQDDLAVLLRSTPIWRIINSDLFFRFFEPLFILTSFNSVVDRVMDLDDQSRYLLLAHILSPHEPARFTFDCKQRVELNPDQGSADRTEYLQDIKCLNDVILTSITELIRKEPDSVILIMSDHGVYADIGPVDDMLLRHKNFMAVRHNDCRDYYQGVSPANLLRVTINCMGAQDVDMLKDRFFPWRSDREFLETNKYGEVLYVK